jgi:hypothetical protein
MRTPTMRSAVLLSTALLALPAWMASAGAQRPTTVRVQDSGVAGAQDTMPGARPAWQQEQADQIQQAGRRLGVPVRTTRMVHFAQNGATFLTAPAANLETIPATQLPRGIDLGVAYLDAPRQAIPTGYYRLRVFGRPRGVGTTDARLQWIGMNGRVAAEVPATVEVSSMTLPAQAAEGITDVTISTVAARPREGCLYKVLVCHRCPNGQVTCWYTCVWAAETRIHNDAQ